MRLVQEGKGWNSGMSNFTRTFCASCRSMRVHEIDLFGSPICVHQHPEQTQEDVLVAWERERERFRCWIAGKDFCQLMDLARDVQKRLEYEERRINSELSKDKYRKLAG